MRYSNRFFPGLWSRDTAFLAATIFWTLAGATADAAPAPEASAELSKCESCHGKGGDSATLDVPRLNGQLPQYLANRIRSFADLTRQNFHAIQFMWNVNSSLSDAKVVALAWFFSAQPPTAAAPAGKFAEQGRKLYEIGDGVQLPACRSCHGPQGEGKGEVPRLAGQHSQYLRLQMESFSLRARVNETMNPHMRTLNHDQIMALVAYLAKD
jgi:cytochrome c553